ncbi:MAG TPA: isochorismatase family cysteine hydrolase, partial [Byssovorax sp.]
MTDTLSLDPRTTALLAMDLQRGILESLPDSGALLGRTAGLLRAARSAGVRVVYVVVAFRPGHPEASPRNKAFAGIRDSGRLVEGSPGTEIHPDVAPEPGEVVVTKRRVGAFGSTDLDVVLRANGIDTLVLAGIATSGVVLSTLRHAADADYSLVVAHDCCADRDDEVHRVLCEKVFPRQATVTTA